MVTKSDSFKPSEMSGTLASLCVCSLGWVCEATVGLLICWPEAFASITARDNTASEPRTKPENLIVRGTQEAARRFLRPYYVRLPP